MQDRNENNGIDFLKDNQDSYAFYKGNYVEVRQQGTVTGGLYRGMTIHLKLILQPHIEDQVLTEEQRKQQGIPFILNWNKEPAFVSVEHVLNVVPRKKAYFDEQVKKYQLKDIIEDYQI